MATKTSAVINYTDGSNNKGTKSITDINPSATPSQITAFTKGLMNLTNDNYVNTNRIDKTELDTAADKTAATLAFQAPTGATEVSMSRASLVNTDSLEPCFQTLVTNSDGKPFLVSRNCFVMVDFFKDPQANKWEVILLTGGAVDDWSTAAGQPIYDVDDNIIAAYPTSGDTGDVVIAIAESDTYTQSNTVTIHITA